MTHHHYTRAESTELQHAHISGIALDGADLTEASFRGANFRGADLTGASFCGADFTGADFRGAVVRGADFTGVDLSVAEASEVRRELDAVLEDLEEAKIRIHDKDDTIVDLEGEIDKLRERISEQEAELTRAYASLEMAGR